MADDEIVIDARLTDGVSRPAERIARKIDDIGDEAQESAAQVAELEAAIAATGKRMEKQNKALEETRAELRGLKSELGDASVNQTELAQAIHLAERRLLKEEAALRKTQRTMKGYTTEVARAVDVQADFNDELRTTGDEAKRTEGFMRKLWNTMGGGGGNQAKAKKNFFSMGKMFRWAFMGVKWSVISAGIGMVLTGMQGLGAAGYASVAGLSPLIGVLGAIPGLAASAAQSMVVLKLGTAGMGDAFKVMMDPKATAKDVAEATKKLHQNQINFLDALIESGKEWGKVKKNIGGALFKDLDRTYKNLSVTYLPIADRLLTRQARMMNSIAKDAGSYLNSTKGVNDVRKVMRTSVGVSDHMLRGVGNLAKTTLVLMNAAAPMLRLMSKDFNNGTGNLEDSAREHDKQLEKFFTNSYALAKRVGSSIADYAMGLYHIGQESDALSDMIGGSLEDIGKDFRNWSGSEAGRAKVRGWFTSMVPIVQELGLWVRDIAKAMTGMSADTDDFLTVSKDLREDALPGITKAIKAFGDGAFETYQNLKEAGVTGGTWRIIKAIGSAIVWTGQKAAEMPSGAKKLLAFATTAYAAYRLMNKFSAGKSILGLLSGGKLGGKIPGVPNGVQPVYVVNMGAGGMGVPGAGGKGGGVAGGASKGGWLARGGNLLKSGPGKVLTGAAIALGITAAINKGLEGFFNNNRADDKGANSIDNVVKRMSQPYHGEDLGGVLGLDLQAKESGPGFLHITEGLQEIIRLGGDTNLDKASKNLNAVDASLANMVNSGNVQGAAAAFTELMEGVRQAGGSQMQFIEEMDEYQRALEDFANRKRLKPLLSGADNEMTRKESAAERKRRLKYADPTTGRRDQGRDDLLAKFKREMLNATEMMNLQLNSGLPSSLIIDISTRGVPKTIEEVTAVATQYSLLKPDIITLLRAAGVPNVKAAAREVLGALKSVDGKMANVKFGVTVTGEEAIYKLMGITTSGVPKSSPKASNSSVGLGGLLEGSRAAGGETKGGTYLTGELGPEAWINKAGQMKMLGLNGPELRNDLAGGAVLPASATSNPWSGAMGNAPEWAREAYLKSIGGSVRAGDAGGSSIIQQVDMSGWINHNETGTDVVRNTQRALERARQELEERK